MSDDTSFQPSEPALCANGCGFFGNAATNNLCSKCYKDVQVKAESAADAKLAFDKFATASMDKSPGVHTNATPTVFGWTSSEKKVEDSATTSGAGVVEKKVATNRCGCCNKKVGLTGFACRCGTTFCRTHRYPEEHNCSFDFKKQGKEAIAKANPVIKGDKIQQF